MKQQILNTAFDKVGKIMRLLWTVGTIILYFSGYISWTGFIWTFLCLVLSLLYQFFLYRILCKYSEFVSSMFSSILFIFPLWVLMVFSGGIKSPLYAILFFMIIGMALSFGRYVAFIWGGFIVFYWLVLGLYESVIGTLDVHYYLLTLLWLILFTPFSAIAAQRYVDVLKAEEKASKLAHKLRIQLKKLKKLRQREHDMIDIMGHELRTPLSIIKNAVGLIDYTDKKEKLKWHSVVKEQYENIKEGLKRELRLVEILLAATKIDAKRLEVRKENVNMLEILHFTKLAFESKAKSKGLKLNFYVNNKKVNNIKNAKGKWIVVGDRVRVQEVVDNLVSNAIKYTNKGSVSLYLSKSDGFIRLDVVDTGIGMSKDEIQRLGKKFYRAKQHLDEHGVIRPGGTGLGLYVTFGLVKAMGGRIFVKSTKGKGSTFSILLPSIDGAIQHSKT